MTDRPAEKRNNKDYMYVAGRRIVLPRRRAGRVALGSGLIVGGIFGFLPVLGFWMIPLGLAFIALDIPWTRHRIHRWMYQLEVELREAKEAQMPAHDASAPAQDSPPGATTNPVAPTQVSPTQVSPTQVSPTQAPPKAPSESADGR